TLLGRGVGNRERGNALPAVHITRRAVDVCTSTPPRDASRSTPGVFDRVADEIRPRAVQNLDTALDRPANHVEADVGDGCRTADRRRSAQVPVPEVVVVAQPGDTVVCKAATTAKALFARATVAGDVVGHHRDVGHREVVAAVDVDAAVTAVRDGAMVHDDVRDGASALRRDLYTVVHAVTDAQAAQDDVALVEVHDPCAHGAGMLTPERDARSGGGRAVDRRPLGHAEARLEPDSATHSEADRSAVAGSLRQRLPQRSGA